MNITECDKLRFLSKVSKEPNARGCLLWKATRNQDGYGNFKLNGTMVKAHRVAYTIVNGPIGEGMHVLHRCDTPACVNPAHLFEGTHIQNMIDREAKGRGHDKSGENNGRAKLTVEEVWQIRDLWKHKIFSQIQIGRYYGISNVVVSKISLFQLWKDSENPYERTPAID